MSDLGILLCLIVPALAVMAIVTSLTVRRSRRIADINPTTGERTDVLP